MSKDKTFKELRKHSIGSSEISGLLFPDQYNSPYKIWLNKTGKSNGFEGNSASERGERYEPFIANYYKTETGNKVIDEKNKIYKHPTIKFIHATPDRKVVSKEKGVGSLECKSTKYAVDQNSIWFKKWFCQNTWQDGIAKRDFGAIAWLSGGLEEGYVEFEFDESFFNFMVEKAIDFWTKYVQTDTPPPPVSSEDIQHLYRKSITGKIVQADKKILTAWHELRDSKELIKTLTHETSQLEDKLKLKMADAELLMDGNDILATWRTSDDKKEFNEEAFKKNHPLLYKKFLINKSGSRRFYVK